MNDFQIMIDMFERAKQKGINIEYKVYKKIDGTEQYIYLYKHKFTFNSNGELLESDITSLNDIL